MSDKRSAGWGRPANSGSHHFFARREGAVLLESACAGFGITGWFWDPSEPLDAGRALHQDGNCIGCRAWLSAPSNRRLSEGARAR